MPISSIVVPITLLYMLVCMVETSHHPYDVLESEPEVVSGYYVDYGGHAFMVIYLGDGIVLICYACSGCYVLCVVVETILSRCMCICNTTLCYQPPGEMYHTICRLDNVECILSRWCMCSSIAYISLHRYTTTMM